MTFIIYEIIKLVINTMISDVITPLVTAWGISVGLRFTAMPK